MTPAALTTAARDAGKRRKPVPKSDRSVPEGRPASPARATAGPRTASAERTSSARSAGHRAPAGNSAVPRRVSGPATGAPRPRRVSGPARGGASARPVTRRPNSGPLSLPRPGELAARASVFVRALPDHRLLDRVVRGRSWIPILGLLLTGIVAMQVETLRLGASTGRSLERVTALQSLNQQLRANVAVLGDDQRIERLAAKMNMIMPGPTQVRFLASHGAPVNRALVSVRAPDAATFLASLPSSAGTAAAAGVGPPTAPTAPPASAATVPVPPAAAPAVTAGVPASSPPSTGTAADGVAPSSAAAVPTGAPATNTGVAGIGSPASSPAASPGASAAVTPAAPTATSLNGATGVPSGG